MNQSDLVSYYRARADEYEKVYTKFERQPDLSELHAIVPEWFAGRHVLEIACGTGILDPPYRWPSDHCHGMRSRSRALEIARTRQPTTAPASFIVADAFALRDLPGNFDASFVGFFWSHVGRLDIARFLTGLHGRLPKNSRVLILDNRYVAGSNWPVTRTDSEGNTYQRRVLDNGREYEVLKNFPTPTGVQDALLAVGAANLAIVELSYYWYATYQTS